jgi:hypothetical protein
MRGWKIRVTLRATLAVLGLAVPLAGAAVAGCSGDDTTGAAGDAATPPPDAAPSDAATPDGTVPADAAGDAIHEAASDATADAGGDAAEGGTIDAGDGGCAVGMSGEAIDLQCAGLYSDWVNKTTAPGVVEYAPAFPLWSDGAGKTRWIDLPAGQQIDTSNMDEWVFPVGTRLWKEFRLPLGAGGAEIRIETRLLWKTGAGTWYRTTYRWSADGTSSATELTTGEADAGAGYEIPSQFKCNGCHGGRVDNVLGFEAVSLAAPGATGLTMTDLVNKSLLTNPPAAPIVVPGTATETAALGWLHANCGISCHNGGNGAAAGSGLFMRLNVAQLASVQATDTYTTGWNQMTSSFQILDAAATYRIHACDTTTSCVYYRASRRTGLAGTPNGIQMPPIDSHKIDDAGLAAVAAWIDEGCDGGK